MILAAFLIALLSMVSAESENVERPVRAPQGQIKYSDPSGLKVDWTLFAPYNQWRTQLEGGQRAQRAEPSQVQALHTRIQHRPHALPQAHPQVQAHHQAQHQASYQAQQEAAQLHAQQQAQYEAQQQAQHQAQYQAQQQAQHQAQYQAQQQAQHQAQYQAQQQAQHQAQYQAQQQAQHQAQQQAQHEAQQQAQQHAQYQVQQQAQQHAKYEAPQQAQAAQHQAQRAQVQHQIPNAIEPAAHYRPYSEAPSFLKQLVLHSFGAQPQPAHVDPNAFLYDITLDQLQGFAGSHQDASLQQHQPQQDSGKQHQRKAARYQAAEESQRSLSRAAYADAQKQQSRLQYPEDYQQQQAQHAPVQAQYPIIPAPTYTGMPTEIQQLLQLQSVIPYDSTANRITSKPKFIFTPKPIPDHVTGPYSYRSMVYYAKGDSFEPEEPEAKPVEEDQRH